MFGLAFAVRWYVIPCMPGLQLSDDLRFHGPNGVRKHRRDAKSRPYVAPRASRRTTSAILRKRRVMLHRAVMSVILCRELAPVEFIFHRDDDPRNNWPENLYLGDRKSNATDSIRNGRQPTGDRHPVAKLLEEQVRTVRLALVGEKGSELAREFAVDKSLIRRLWAGSGASTLSLEVSTLTLISQSFPSGSGALLISSINRGPVYLNLF